MRTACGLAGIVMLTACFPVVQHYERIEAPEAVYFKALCHGGFGPPSTVYYPFHGVFISIDLQWMQLGLHVPPGMTADLKGDSVHVRGWTDSGFYDRVVHIREFPLGSVGNGAPPEFDQLNWTLYLGIDDRNPDRLAILPSDLLRGTIELPPIAVNGQTFEAQTLRLERNTYRGLMTANC